MGSESFRILFVDDSEVQLQQVQDALFEQGYDLVTARNVDEAKPRLASCDLVIVDFHLEDMDGAQALAELKQHPDVSPETLFYLYTSDKDVAVHYRSHGFDGAFTRKGEPQVLLSQLETAARIIKLRRLRNER